MKTHILFFVFSVISIFLVHSQDYEFQWAQAYDVDNCNELAALAVDSSNNIIIAGVHEGDEFVPYTGYIYIIKTNPEGETLWSADLIGELIMSEIITMNTDIIIAGQAYGSFVYQGNNYGEAPYYMFVIKLDENGNVVWFFEDDSKMMTYGNLAKGENDTFVIHTRTGSNLGDWIMIMDLDGNLQNSKLISADHTLVEHIAYYNNKVYMNCQLSGIISIFIDELFIPASPMESTAFVIALDENLVGEWVSIDTTLTNGDGRVEANVKGIFAYQETLSPPFNLIKNLKKFNFEGELINEVVVPSSSTGIILRPDMEITDDYVGMYCKNSFNNDSYILHIFKINDLEHIQEKVVSGAMGHYSSHLAAQDQNFILGGIQNGELNLNDEITIPYTGSGATPYIAKIEETTTIDIEQTISLDEHIIIYPNPATDKITIKSGSEIKHVDVYNQVGQNVQQIQTNNNFSNVDVSEFDSGIYFIKVYSKDKVTTKKLVIK